MTTSNSEIKRIRVGVSLPLDYLAGRANDLYSKSLGHPADFLEKLKLQGVESIELRSLNSGTAPERAVEAARRIEDVGMHWTVHGSLPSPDGPAFLDASVKALGHQSHLASSGKHILITVHAHRSKTLSITEMAEHTVKTIHHLIEQAESEGLSLHWAIELCRFKDVMDPGANPRTLLELVERIARPEVGICLDIGHSHSNILKGFHDFAFSEAFLKRVVHMHVHDVGPEDQTHFPLTCQNLPLDDYCRLLVRNGYRGIMNLELSPAKFTGLIGLQEAYLESVSILKRRLIPANAMERQH